MLRVFSIFTQSASSLVESISCYDQGCVCLCMFVCLFVCPPQKKKANYIVELEGSSHWKTKKKRIGFGTVQNGNFLTDVDDDDDDNNDESGKNSDTPDNRNKGDYDIIKCWSSTFIILIIIYRIWLDVGLCRLGPCLNLPRFLLKIKNGLKRPKKFRESLNTAHIAGSTF